jgi:type I restriction enzyme S subunit
MKRYDSYKDSGIEWIGEIPSHWEYSPVKYFTEIVNGSTPSSNEESYWNGDINWVTTDDLGKLNHKYIISTRRTITELGYRSCGTTIAPKGSVVISSRAPIGHLGILKIDACTNQGCKTLIPLNINSEFLYYYLVNGRNELEALGQGSTFKELPTSALKGFKIISPPIEEQAVIANYLHQKTTQIDGLIAKKERLIQLLEEERVAIINQSVTKGLDPTVPMKDSGIGWLGEIPEHWEVKKLKQIFNSSKGLTITKENLEEEGIPCVNYGEIHSKFGFEVDIDKHHLKCVNSNYLESDYKSLIQNGDFVFADTSEDVTGAGNFTYLKSNHEIFAGYHTIILRAIRDIESRFFAYQFDSIPFRTQIRQSVKGIKVFSITQGILKNASLWIPTLDEQEQIIKFLDVETDRIVSIKNSTRKEIELLKEYKIALIGEVVTGKVDVRNQNLN